MTALLHLSMLEALRLWSDLEQALHGTNGFGGHTAEIYAYRFGGRPIAYEVMASVKEETDRHCAHALFDFLALFRSQHPECEVAVDGRSFGAWVAERPFGHRSHVTVIPMPSSLEARVTRANRVVRLAQALVEAADLIESWIPYARDPHEADDGGADAVARFRALAAEVLP